MNFDFYKTFLLAFFCLTASSCKKLIEIDPPKNSLVQESILQNNDLANSAMTGIYRKMIGYGYASGNSSSLTTIAGLTADELINYSATLTEFFENQILPVTGNLATLYSSPYQNIYASNTILEGLEKPNGVTVSVKRQLRGEALFIRAFSYFYLINTFGSVPLHLTSDYRITGIAARASVATVYQQIITDLKEAELLLNIVYISTERIRPNLATVQALLARTYLYTQEWANAEKYASFVLENTNMYSLVGLDSVFLKNSQEAIWQLMPGTDSGNTNEGLFFILTGTPSNVSLDSNLIINGFEPHDKRRIAWLRSFSATSGTYYYSFKYKMRTISPVTEYSMVMRLAEQFLIRAEARARQNNIIGAIDDLDMIRKRAGLAPIRTINPNITISSLLSAIQSERRVELFCEWGHRWFDLKRTGAADLVLGPIKPRWEDTDVLYPIPQDEISHNPNISQNEGY